MENDVPCNDGNDVIISDSNRSAAEGIFPPPPPAVVAAEAEPAPETVAALDAGLLTPGGGQPELAERSSTNNPVISRPPPAVASLVNATTSSGGGGGNSISSSTSPSAASLITTGGSSHQSILRASTAAGSMASSTSLSHSAAPADAQQSTLRQLAHSPAAANNNNSRQVQQLQPQVQPYQQQPLPQQQQQQQQQGSSHSLPSIGSRLSLNAPEVETADTANSASSPSRGSGWAPSFTTEGVPPSARSLHAAALLNGNMYIFGGYDGAQRVNTFHAYSFAEKRWSPVLPSGNSPPPPSPRDRHAAIAYENSFYVHGGFDGTSRVSDFWAFDFSTMTWREVNAQGRPPSARHSHAAVVHEGSLYIFGGYDGSYKSDLHEFDFQSSRWGAVPAAGRRPRARYRATCVIHKNSMILYGGHDGTRHLSDTHIFDLESKIWSSLVIEGTPPIPRDSHVSVVHGNSMYVFGGSSGSAMNDMHELQLPTNTSHNNNSSNNNNNNSNVSAPARWRSINVSRGEQPRHRFCHVAGVHNDSMYIFGGYDGSDRLNDFVRFDFAVYDLTFEVPASTIISDMRRMINDSTMSDITFIVEDQPVYAHKLMLMRCSYFQALFLGQMRESRLSTICIEQVRRVTFLLILEYLYTDQVRIPLNNAMELFEAADLFCIPRLKTMCEKRMLQSITVENAASIFHAADMHSATALREKAKKYILAHFEEVSKSGSFEEMGRSNIELVFELLQSR